MSKLLDKDQIKINIKSTINDLIVDLCYDSITENKIDFLRKSLHGIMESANISQIFEEHIWLLIWKQRNSVNV